MNALVVLVTFVAAGVEWVEALTIVLAVALFRGWRSALVGTAVAFAALVVLVAVFGLAVTSHVSIAAARTLVGVLLLLFGLKWLHKAILRSSGLRSLHDEARAFEQARQTLVASGVDAGGGIDRTGAGTAFSGVFLEGLEVVFIVVALGGLRSVPAASLGAAASLLAVAGAGIALRRPLTRVPENAMKYVVGIMLTSFGTFFAGEGLGVAWWRSDASLLPLIAAYGLASVAFVLFLKRPPRSALAEIALVRTLRTGLLELWGLFVGDGALAVAALAALLGVAVFADHFGGRRGLAGALLVVGVLLSIAIGLAGALRQSGADPASQDARPREARLGDADDDVVAGVPDEVSIG